MNYAIFFIQAIGVSVACLALIGLVVYPFMWLFYEKDKEILAACYLVLLLAGLITAAKWCEDHKRPSVVVAVQ